MGKHWLLAAALAYVLPAFSAIVPVSGGILDETTGLQWVSMPATRGFSWEEAGDVPGMRLATGEELTALFEHAGIHGTSGTDNAPSFLLQTWGSLTGSHGSTDAEFWLADSQGEFSHAVGRLGQFVNPATGESAGWIATSRWDWRRGDSEYWVGAALIRTPTVMAQQVSAVPEPSTWILTAFGLLGVFLQRRQRSS